jgi:hypothetical protein
LKGLVLEGKVATVIGAIRRLAKERHLEAAARRVLSRLCGYFSKHRGRMRYDEYLREGNPFKVTVFS